MIGYIAWTGEKSPRRTEELSVLRMRFCRGTIFCRHGTPAPIVRRRTAAVARRLQKLGVTRAVFPSAFPHEEIFAKRGILPVEVMPLYRTLAAEWLRCALAARGLPVTAAVAVCGEQLTGEITRTMTELCLRHRYVLLDVPRGGEELARQLRREYGVPLQLRPTAEQMAMAAATLAFAPRTDLKNPVVLALYNGAEPPRHVRLTLPPQLEEQLPLDCRRDQLLAALTGAGMLRPAQIELSMVEGSS